MRYGTCALWVETVRGRRIKFVDKTSFPWAREWVGGRASERMSVVKRVRRAVWGRQAGERCKRASGRASRRCGVIGVDFIVIPPKVGRCGQRGK